MITNNVTLLLLIYSYKVFSQYILIFLIIITQIRLFGIELSFYYKNIYRLDPINYIKFMEGIFSHKWKIYITKKAFHGSKIISAYNIAKIAWASVLLIFIEWSMFSTGKQNMTIKERIKY